MPDISSVSSTPTSPYLNKAELMETTNSPNKHVEDVENNLEDANSMSRQSSKYRTSNPVSSHVFLISAYEQILEAKSVRRYSELKSETIRALDLAKSEGFSKERASLPHNIDVILQPFLLSCKTDSQTLTLIGLDGLSKLISYDYLADSNFSKDGQFQSSLGQPINKDGIKERSTTEKAVLAICGCFVCETTEDKVQTQVIKGLMAAVSSATTPIHQEALLNAIRTLYNIFLLSRDVNNQIIAQGTLVQMARTVFGRIDLEALNTNTISRTSSKSSRKPRSNAEVLSNLDGDDNDSDQEIIPDLGQLSLEAIGGKAAEAAANSQVQGNICDTNSDLNVLDAFLLFRALCKLSVKPYQADGSSDVRCMSLRSKLLSLYLILTTVTEFPAVFTKSKVYFVTPSSDTNSPRKIREETFLNAVKPYLCISLSRNLVSTLPKVYEMTLAVFELFMTTMRHHLKREIEVILKEIIIPILEMKPVGNQHQKHLMLAMLVTKICTDSQLLVDIYLNYDCGRGSLNNNIFERLTSALSKLTLPSRSPDSEEQSGYLWDEIDTYYVGSNTMTREDLVSLPPLTSDRFTGYFMNHSFFSRMQFTDANLQQRSLECLVGILKSLVQWSNRGLRIVEETNGLNGRSNSLNGKPSLTDDDASETSQSMVSDFTAVGDMVSTADDPTQFEKIKTQKQTLRRGIELFNRKPKKGIENLLADGVIASSDPRDVVEFLLTTLDLDKNMVGEYLGDGDKYNVSIMHEFVDRMQFKGLEFVAALRHFLSGFRLPGEAQKIDRFMLKFAERYVEQNPTMFSNADCAYVLAYSVIMLNTDLHNPQVKRRMTKSEFIKNNRGINDSSDLPEELLENIYDQIANLEIKLKDDSSSPDPTPTSTSASGVFNTGLAAQFDILGARSRKANDIATANSKRMSSNAERYLTKMLSRKSYMNEMGGMSIFYSASHFEHVKPMFEVSWMAVLAAISGPLKDSELSSVINQCLDGFRYAVHIAGFFDLDLARSAFVTTLGNFSFLSDISEMRPKNVEAIKAILDIAVAEGNYLKGAWNDVLQVVNHLVRLQLVPNFSATTNGRDRSLVAHRDSQIRQVGQIALLEGNSQNMLIAVDKVFASSVYLNGPAIVDFIKALAAISWAELENMPKAFDRSRAQSSPRMFSIQKVVEVAYYNMNRIRLEWKEMWTVLGPLFNQVGCHRNEVISAFAVDSLRQLAMKFLEKPELAHYQFQKAFLTPFTHIIVHNPNESIKDMVLQCTTQMLRTYRENIKSGWFTILEILSRAANDRSDEIVRQALQTTKGLSEDSFHEITHPEVFPVYLNCLAQFAKHPEYQKLGLQAVDTFKTVCDRVIAQHESEDQVDGETVLEGEAGYDLTFYNPIFQNLMSMVMEVLDLEIRSKAMDLMFDYLHQHGNQFPSSFWHHILDDVLFPLFSDLGKLDHKVRIRFASREDSMVWLSTTLVQALAKFVNLFTVYFDQVFQFLDGLLDLLSVCLCQDNPTLVKIGSDCLKSLVEKNVEKLAKPDWERILSIIIRLFKATTRIDLTDKSSATENLTISSRANNLSSQHWLETFDTKAPVPLVPTTPAQQLNLGLTMVNLVEDTFLQHDTIFNKLEPTHIFVILDVVERSYLETQAINSQFDLKGSIERQAVTKMEKFAATSLSLELSSLVCLIKVLLKMYIDESHHYSQHRTEIEARLIPLCKDSFHQFNLLSEYPMAPGLKNIYQLWHQVVLRIGNFLCKASGTEFMTVFGPSSKEIITTLKHQHLSPEIQAMLFNVMSRVDSIYIHRNDNSETNSTEVEVVTKFQAKSNSSNSSYYESN